MSKRVWFAREAQFTADPKVQALGHEYGPVGPLVVEEIFALAKLSESDGRVQTTYAVLAGRAFSTAAKVRNVVGAAIDLGLFEVDGDQGPKGCALSIPRWSRWQVKDPTAAARKSRQRHGEVTQMSRESHADVTPLSRDVTALHRHRQRQQERPSPTTEVRASANREEHKF